MIEPIKSEENKVDINKEEMNSFKNRMENYERDIHRYEIGTTNHLENAAYRTRRKHNNRHP